MSRKPSVAQIVAVLELVARYYGLGVLTGSGTPPTREEVEELFLRSRAAADLGVRVMGGRTIPEAERLVVAKEMAAQCLETIQAVGGWAHIAASFAAVRAETPKYWWRVVGDYVMYIKPGGQIRSGDRSMAARLFGAEGKHQIDLRTARNWMHQVLRSVAIWLISFPPDKNFEINADSLESGVPR